MDTIECLTCHTKWEQEPEGWGDHKTHPDLLQYRRHPWADHRTVVACPACLKKDRINRWTTLCPPLYQDTDPKRLSPTLVSQVMAWRYGPQGLLLTGETGLGKSRLAWMLLRHLYIEEGIKPKAFDCVSFGHECSRRFRGDEADGEEWASGIAEARLVFFDDLGKLKLTERAEMELFGVIERRSANKLPIIATTNDTGDTLAARMTENRGPAMIRRLREFCQVIHLT